MEKLQITHAEDSIKAAAERQVLLWFWELLQAIEGSFTSGLLSYACVHVVYIFVLRDIIQHPLMLLLLLKLLLNS